MFPYESSLLLLLLLEPSVPNHKHVIRDHKCRTINVVEPSVFEPYYCVCALRIESLTHLNLLSQRFVRLSMHVKVTAMSGIDGSTMMVPH